MLTYTFLFCTMEYYIIIIYIYSIDVIMRKMLVIVLRFISPQFVHVL